jgi:hypothetical protein
MKPLYLFSVLLLTACGAQAPQIVAGKGAVYGILKADSNKVVKEKAKQNASSTSDVYSSDKSDGIVYKDNMVNYSALDDLYVGLVFPNPPPHQHTIHATAQGFSPRSIAMAPGDVLQVRNDTGQPQSFFVTQSADSGDGIQSFPVLAAGSGANYPIFLTGNLELLSESDANLQANLFSRKNMLSKRLKSGETYHFENLTPGQYQLIFWYWRLGKIEQQVEIKAGENVHIDKTLSVDSVMRSQ